ncbi:hypothetical protein ZYGR_0AD03710 [Zygosaccharomyces rouxii]|uniref:Inositolphosphotransferase Aur1/Ipt1 domain-containing protein n=1 Tax=Zygosaccharomyces rouxii TaxID=4956 RepID=A0A1Q3A696_ZYGRO|nr:hypothetical protein ZYGR_0AD03710 [Zygosaccharomyces rouxii]
MSARFLRGCYNVVFGCVIKRLYRGGLNQRNLLTLPLNFFTNFSIIFIWLMIFKNAGLIPIDIRPKIHSKAAFYLDNYMFGDFWGEMYAQFGKTSYFPWTIFTSVVFTSIFLLLIPLAIWYYIYYVKKLDYNLMEWNDHIFHFSNKSNPKRVRTLCIPFLLPFFALVFLNIMHIFAKQTEENFANWKDFVSWVSYVILHLTAPILTAVYLYVFHPPGVVKCFALSLGIQNLMGVTTHLLLPMAPPWFIHMYGITDTEHVNYTQEGYAAGLVRVDKQLGTHLNTSGFHMSPIVFGAVPSLHSAMAFQCFLFLITRSATYKGRMRNGISPSRKEAAPIFISESSEETEIGSSPELPLGLAGDDELELRILGPEGSTNSSCEELEATADRCDAPGTLALYYVHDAEFCTRWYFGIFNRAILPRLLGISFLLWQWWSTMYLDHHYRFDLFVGVLYALFVHILINHYVLQPKVLQPWLAVRLQQIPDTRNEGRTMGMRVFEDTKLEWFFDPLA